MKSYGICLSYRSLTFKMTFIKLSFTLSSRDAMPYCVAKSTYHQRSEFISITEEFSQKILSSICPRIGHLHQTQWLASSAEMCVQQIKYRTDDKYFNQSDGRAACRPLVALQFITHPTPVFSRSYKMYKGLENYKFIILGIPNESKNSFPSMKQLHIISCGYSGNRIDDYWINSINSYVKISITSHGQCLVDTF